ncbi:MAG: hypothetical protein JSS41_10150 [Proteobacteria bacterium]|nr:hypothetical protein [Pseudomonadota bacterium]
MEKVEAIEHQVAALQPEELAVFRAWFVAFDGHVWDRKLADDVAAGRLDALAEQALRSHAEGKTTAL